MPRQGDGFTPGSTGSSIGTGADQGRHREVSDTPHLRPGTPPTPGPGPSFARFTNLVQIGAGGMGRVYRAHDPTLGRAVALKLIHHDEPRLAQRLLQEARAQAQVEHPHVCPIYEAGEHQGRPHIAMQPQPLGQLNTSLPADVQALGIVIPPAASP